MPCDVTLELVAYLTDEDKNLTTAAYVRIPDGIPDSIHGCLASIQ